MTWQARCDTIALGLKIKQFKSVVINNERISYAYLQVMEALNMWRSFARRLSYPSSKSKSSFRPIATPSMYTFTNSVRRRRRAEAVKALLRNGLIGGQSWVVLLPLLKLLLINKCRRRAQGNRYETCCDRYQHGH